MIPCTVFLGSPPCLRQPPTVTVPTKTQEEWVFNVEELNCQLKLRLVRDLPSFSVVSDRRRYHFHVRLVQTKRMMETIDWALEIMGINWDSYWTMLMQVGSPIRQNPIGKRSGTHSRVPNLRVEPMERTSWRRHLLRGSILFSWLETLDFYVKYPLFCHLAVELWSVPTSSCFLQLEDFIVLKHWCFLHFKQSKHALCEPLGLSLWHRGKFWLKTLQPGRWDSLQNSNSLLILEIFNCTRTISSCGLHGMYTFLSLLECEYQDVTSQPENMSCSPLESKVHLQEICKHSKFTEFCQRVRQESNNLNNFSLDLVFQALTGMFHPETVVKKVVWVMICMNNTLSIH